MNARSSRLVCLGGTLCDDRLFGPLLERVNRPGKVRSYDCHDRVSDAATALLREEVGAFIVVGFSLGGFVAVETLRQAPERISAVILLSGNAFPDDPKNAERRRGEVATGRLDGLGDLIRSQSETLVSNTSGNRQDIIGTIAGMADSLGSDVHARHAEMNIHRPDLRGTIEASNRPILVLAGAGDLVCPLDRYHDLARSPAVTLTMVDGAGHFLPLEAPERCAELINAFLKDHGL